MSSQSNWPVDSVCLDRLNYNTRYVNGDFVASTSIYAPVECEKESKRRTPRMHNRGFVLMQTKEDMAYDALKRCIMFGELPQGQFLSQRMLAERVETTTGTVRSVLRRLENDGLIENVPRWGVRIPAETEETVKDRYYLRELLEAAAIRRIWKRDDPEELRILTTVAARVDAVLADPDPDVLTWAERHNELHQKMIELAGSQSLLEAYIRINMRSRMLLNATRSWERIVADGTTGHQIYIREVFAEDEEASVRTVVAHAHLGLKLELQAIRLQKDGLLSTESTSGRSNR
jgi:DNA-binding GntR family transcriptional regulator